MIKYVFTFFFWGGRGRELNVSSPCLVHRPVPEDPTGLDS